MKVKKSIKWKNRRERKTETVLTVDRDEVPERGDLLCPPPVRRRVETTSTHHTTQGRSGDKRAATSKRKL